MVIKTLAPIVILRMLALNGINGNHNYFWPNGVVTLLDCFPLIAKTLYFMAVMVIKNDIVSIIIIDNHFSGTLAMLCDYTICISLKQLLLLNTLNSLYHMTYSSVNEA